MENAKEKIIKLMEAMKRHQATGENRRVPTFPNQVVGNPQPIVGGVGTELKSLLSKFGIKSTENCACNKRAELMDRNGVKWCRENVEQIVTWLHEEAQRRHLPFIRTAGKLLVKRAIKNYEKKHDNNTKIS